MQWLRREEGSAGWLEEEEMHDAAVVTMEEEERKVVNEFCHLLEKSKQLFNGLRDMAQVQIYILFEHL